MIFHLFLIWAIRFLITCFTNFSFGMFFNLSHFLPTFCDSEACKHVIKGIQCQYIALSFYCTPTCYCISFFLLSTAWPAIKGSPDPLLRCLHLPNEFLIYFRNLFW